jgi:hypothetical protein
VCHGTCHGEVHCGKFRVDFIHPRRHATAGRDAALGNGALAAHLSAIVEAMIAASRGRLRRVTLMQHIDALPVDSPEARFITSHIVTGSP